ncbi:thioredoxin family protein [Pedobacter caeni]|uniref:Thioredoxin-like n=1 Tax=Pedobacter caeni TaxID=288992 RepID=A0A1M5HIX0_9SPHI|nr:thioredoxin family protein [Pedobacter caeni]SHG15914.1 Thioredoxin-like [Pedobacter caeni]
MKIKHLLLTLCALVFFATSYAQESAKSADIILKTAYKQAAKENKKVFVIFHASWCGWCHKLDKAMNDASCKQLLDDSYVTCHLTVMENDKNKHLENPGAIEFMKNFRGDKSGIPFFLILDKDGKLLADSQIRPEGASLDTPGENMGCPASKEEIAAFQKVLKKTSKLSEAQITLIGARFAVLNGK